MPVTPFADEPKGRPEETVQLCKELYTACDNARRQQEAEWYTNCLFLAGDQWEVAAEDVRRNRSIHVHAPHTKVKIVSNQILGLARQCASAQSENMAGLVAAAATNEPEDIAAAELATDLLQAYFEEHNEREVCLNEILWAMVAGRVLRCTYWDPDADGTGIGGVLPGAGEIATRTLNPFQFHMSPWVSASEDMPFVILSDVRDVEEIREIYGKGVKEESVAQAVGTLDRLLRGILQGATGDSTPRRKHAAIVKQLYCRPSTKRPKGRLIVWCGEGLLDDGDLPEGQMLDVPCDWFPVPGRAYPLPFVTPLRPLQREINIALSQIVEFKNRSLRGDMVLRGSGQVTSDVDEETGAKRIYIPENIREWKLMEYVQNVTEAERLLVVFWNDMMKAAGLHEQALGENPRGNVTLGQIQLLREADLQGLTLFRSIRDRANAKIGRAKLLIAHEHYEIPRLLRVVGEANAVDVSYFRGADLRSTQDVRAVPAPVLTETMKAAIRTDAWKGGLYDWTHGPQDMLHKVRALLNLGLPGMREEIDAALAPMTLDQLKAMVGRITGRQAQTAVIASELALDQLVHLATVGPEPASPTSPGSPSGPASLPREIGVTQPQPVAQPALPGPSG
jgi:hypothetical protein